MTTFATRLRTALQTYHRDTDYALRLYAHDLGMLLLPIGDPAERELGAQAARARYDALVRKAHDAYNQTLTLPRLNPKGSTP